MEQRQRTWTWCWSGRKLLYWTSVWALYFIHHVKWEKERVAWLPEQDLWILYEVFVALIGFQSNTAAGQSDLWTHAGRGGSGVYGRRLLIFANLLHRHEIWNKRVKNGPRVWPRRFCAPDSEKRFQRPQVWWWEMSEDSTTLAHCGVGDKMSSPRINSSL